MNTRAVWISGLILCAASIGACGGSSNKKAATDGGKTDGGPTADAGKPDAGKTGAAGSTMMTMTAMPVPCGTNMCQPPAGLGGMLGGLGGMIPGGAAGGMAGLPMPVACCLVESSGTCGMAPMMGATCEGKATPDTHCPSIALPAAFAMLAGGMGFGCCASGDQCGVDGAAFGRGCVANPEAKTMLAGIPLIGGFLMVPPAQACSGGGADAGTVPTTSDAGR